MPLTARAAGLLAALAGAGALAWHYLDWVEHRESARDVQCSEVVDWDWRFTPVDTDRTLIAHAAGGTPHGFYANAFEALDYHYARGVRMFEIDFAMTRDGRVVALHNWETNFRRWYEYDALPFSERWRPARIRREGVLYEHFMAVPRRCGMTQFDLPRLRDWLERHPDAVIITDVKAEDNLAVLETIAAEHGPMLVQFVVQVFGEHEIEPARALGYERIALTDYVGDHGIGEMARIAHAHGLHALVIHHSRLDAGVEDALDGLRVWSYVVNDPATLDALPRAVEAVMTDRLLPAR